MTDKSQVLPTFLLELVAHFGLAADGIEALAPNQWHVPIEKPDLLRMAEYLVKERHASLATIVGCDERSLGRDFALYHVFFLPTERAFLALSTHMPEMHLGFLSIAQAIPAANWAERELQDLFGFHAVGHPDPRRLVSFGDWPVGVYPLRKDFDPQSVSQQPLEPFELTHVEGEGVFEVPVGPFHGGIIEPGHFRFSVDGEHIIHLELRLFWKHRGIEKHAEGMNYEHGVLMAERVCGACSFANALAYCQAVEQLTHCAVPERAAFMRVVGAELERLTNHVGDIAGVLNDVGFATGAAQGLHLRERLLDFNEGLAGHRLLMGLCIPGGVRSDLDARTAKRLEALLNTMERDFTAWMKLIQSSESLSDRLETTGVLNRQTAVDLGALGPTARASGVDQDTRRDHPYAAYPKLKLKVVTAEKGDVLARVRVKAGECLEAISLIKQAMKLMPQGPLSVPLGESTPGKWALGITESARGENLAFVMAGAHNTIERYKVRTSSYMNWPTVPLAALGNIVPDFPVINKSFNLCYACTDR